MLAVGLLLLRSSTSAATVAMHVRRPRVPSSLCARESTKTRDHTRLQSIWRLVGFIFTTALQVICVRTRIDSGNSSTADITAYNAESILRVSINSSCIFNNDNYYYNNRISIAPYGRNVGGAGGSSDQCSVDAITYCDHLDTVWFTYCFSKAVSLDNLHQRDYDFIHHCPRKYT